MPGTTCVITAGGNVISTAAMSLLLKVTTTRKAGGSADTCSVDFDDTGGQIALPATGSDMTVTIGGAQTFVGVVDKVNSKGDRNGGRVLTVAGKSFDTKGKAKSPQSRHWDNQSLSSVFGEAARLAGLSGAVAGAIGSVQRQYWAMQGESFIHWGERVAREIGGTFKVVGNRAILADRNSGLSIGGAALSVVRAVYGDNLISWDVAPVEGRAIFGDMLTRWYDPAQARWMAETAGVPNAAGQSPHLHRFASADQGEAGRNSQSRGKDSDRNKGAGNVTINGTPAEPEATCLIIGARPGVDGIYRIDTVTDDFARNSGWITKLALKQPHGDAGTDSRGGT